MQQWPLLVRSVHDGRTVSNRATLLALVAVLAGAGAFALVKKPAAPPPEPISHAQEAPLDPPAPTRALPPGHPPVGSGSPQGRVSPPADEPAALTWTAPPAWQSMPNPNSMRMATYRIPHAGQDTDDAEMSISRAGGSTEANLDRWVRQFDDAGKDTRTKKTIHGMPVTIVEVSGSYLSGSMMGGATAKKTGWSLLGAIVETGGSSYFFKMVGPTATVRAARDGFTRMIDALAPPPSP
jgi:hypothetical protein